jgi:uncharacterized protein YyaL (SSP411 family)
VDDKILTAWNGLMLKVRAAYRAFDEPVFLNKLLKRQFFSK